MTADMVSVVDEVFEISYEHADADAVRELQNLLNTRASITYLAFDEEDDER
jgi:hypothetical protein